MDDTLFDPTQTSGEMIGVSEIALLAGVTKAAVSNWRARATRTGFPAPVQESRAGPLYDREEIERWLESHRGSAPVPLGIESTLWSAADKLRGSIDPARYKTVALSLLFLKFVSDLRGTTGSPFVVPKAARWERIAIGSAAEVTTRLEAAAAELEKANPQLEGVLSADFAAWGVDSRRLAGIVQLFDSIHLDRDSERDVLGRTYEYFLGRFASAEGRGGGEFYTPSAVVKLLVEMIEPLGGTVYDPCCGSGGMFVQSLRFLEAHNGARRKLAISGQELNPATWRIARMNLALHGLDGHLGAAPADTFFQDQHPSLKANYVLANPPFNMSDWGAADLADDPRWSYGLPPSANANFAWVQHIISHLGPKGVAGIVLANGSMTAQGTAEASIRRALIEANLVDCMVALPGQLFYSTSIPACLWFIRKARRPDAQVLFLDARAMGHRVTRAHRTLADDEIQRLSMIYHRWRATPSADSPYEDVPGLARSVSRDEIAAESFVLSPARFVGVESEDEEEVRDIKTVADDVLGLLTDSDRLAKTLRSLLKDIGL